VTEGGDGMFAALAEVFVSLVLSGVYHLGGEETGVLIVDETGFLKKGEKSVGVARQYTGTAGDTVNCQAGAYLCYASEKGAAFLDRALYLPKKWTGDPAGRSEAGVPEGAS